MKLLINTSTRVLVELSPKIRFEAQRHSNRRTGSSVWDAYFLIYGKYKVKNPMGEWDIVEKWGVRKGTYKNTLRSDRYDYKKDFMAVLQDLDDKGLISR